MVGRLRLFALWWTGGTALFEGRHKWSYQNKKW